MRLYNLSAAALLAQPSFPRISTDEELLIRDWLLDAGRAYDAFSIDVPIGAARGRVLGTAAALAPREDVFDRMWRLIRRRRIDVVAFRGNSVTIVEAKIHATMRAASQVRNYCDGYAGQYPTYRTIVPVIICRTAVPGLASLMFSIGGRLIEVRPIDASDAGTPAHFV